MAKRQHRRRGDITLKFHFGADCNLVAIKKRFLAAMASSDVLVLLDSANVDVTRVEFVSACSEAVTRVTPSDWTENEKRKGD